MFGSNFGFRSINVPLRMSFDPARSLEELLQAEGKRGEAEAVSTMLGLLEAASTFHRLSMAYAGFKPSHVMVTESGRLTVIDMSCAGRLGEHPYSRHIGYSPYDERTSPAYDIYMIGRFGLTMLLGRTPDQGTPWKQAPLPDDLGISPELRAILERATSAEPAHRFQSADEMMDALKALPSYAN